MSASAEDLAIPAAATVPPPPVLRRAPGRAGMLALSLGAFAVLAAGGWVFPRWLTFLLTMAAGNGLVSLGIVGLMRGGVVPFGQGMVFAAGGYAAALLYNKLGFTDAIGLTLAGGVAALLVAAPFAPLLSRYRGIFFAMLTLALSMVMYGLLSKASVVGGTDGLTVAKPTLFGAVLTPQHTAYPLYALTIVIAAGAASAVLVYKRSVAGLLAQAVRANGLRVEYLGASAQRSVGTSLPPRLRSRAWLAWSSTPR